MRFLFLSPFFPPNAPMFCRALHARGAEVLAVGDQAPEHQPPELEGVLSEYVFEPGMQDYRALRDAVAILSARHGLIDRLDSNSEHWLEAEGRLRDDFSVSGLGYAEVRALRSKLKMGKVFVTAGIAYPPTMRSHPDDSVRSFAQLHGLPLVFKPDAGSGAVDTFVVKDEAELEAALARRLSGHVVQPFVSGNIVTFDGLTNAAGEIVFCTSHAYDLGIMQVRESQADGHYYSLRTIPQELERIGRLAVAAFAIRERFFHLEFFARPSGDYMGLEINVRPPGGYTTEMMSAACDFNVYDLWAGVVTGQSLAGFSYERRYHTAHAGRRAKHAYRLSPQQLSQALGKVLFCVQSVPEAFSATMGNVAYLLRSANLDELRHAVALVQDRAKL